MMAKPKVNYDIVNCKKFNWYDTQAYEFNQDDNNGYVHGYVQWYGKQDLDDALDYSDDEVYWSWFKTEQERDEELQGVNDG